MTTAMVVQPASGSGPVLWTLLPARLQQCLPGLEPQPALSTPCCLYPEQPPSVSFLEMVSSLG